MIKDEILNFMREKAYSPMTTEQLMKAFGIDISQYSEFQSLLNEMEYNGDIIRTKKGKYGVPERMDMAVGIIECNKKGFGFLRVEDGEDIFIPAEDINGAMNGDKVIVRITRRAGEGTKREGTVVNILERANKEIVGTLDMSKNFGFVIPDDQRLTQDIYIAREGMNGAKDGQKVVVRITRWPEPRRNPEGVIVDILGDRDDPEANILAIIKQHDLPQDFPNKVKKEAAAIEQSISIEEIARRKDLRGIKTVTIDGEDAKDLDDAVSIKKLADGNYELYVHIADVSNYVKEGSALDKEAYKRGCSVYLGDRVIPMLPRELSNGICSLNPKEDRLTLTVQMVINKKGEVVFHDIFESVINSDERMTYTNVYRILEENDEELKKRYDYLVDDFQIMKELALILMEKRKNRGSIDFDIPEAKIVLGELGDILDIGVRERNIAHRIIEEFMLVCNETVAEHMFWLNSPFIYRVHEEPNSSDILELNAFLHNLGYHIKGAGSQVHPRAIQELLDSVKGKKEEKLVNTLALRSMKRARYSDQCLGHFSLAVKYYTHFTSPIRRYPDLTIHRIIKDSINGRLDDERMAHYNRILADIAEQSSVRERVAEEAERDVEELRQVQYMTQHIGEQFEGIISGVTSFGLFVELDNLVEGLVHINNMVDDYYHFDDKNHCLVGEHTNKVYRLGDVVKVELVGADVTRREIDFLLVE
ncbi:ribonuclease R [Caldanaerobius fijiensis DSM 17918]|uniref:Ribonuclease R n=1 Tax=Caldanaerobius fijiensis DSM 17918 TaxID=1121256 RepID=A0A1M5CSV2_9THEO|nr:ribonuclease R [Caldanaerobius fijiensis]SHF57707.1 ribonuclease R [Caldanaerobius fijiensis DSM 17918]